MDIFGDFNSNFWAGVGIAAAVATALATGVATLLSAWWRWRDRAEAEWSATLTVAGGRDWDGDPTDAPEVSFNLTNVGDGTAFKVSALGASQVDAQLRVDGGNGFSSATPLIASMRTGESVKVRASCSDPKDWDSAYVTIQWWHPPTRRRRKWLGLRSAQLSERFYLRDIAPDHGAKVAEWHPKAGDDIYS